MDRTTLDTSSLAFLLFSSEGLLLLPVRGVKPGAKLLSAVGFSEGLSVAAGATAAGARGGGCRSGFTSSFFVHAFSLGFGG